MFTLMRLWENLCVYVKTDALYVNIYALYVIFLQPRQSPTTPSIPYNPVKAHLHTYNYAFLW